MKRVLTIIIFILGICVLNAQSIPLVDTLDELERFSLRSDITLRYDGFIDLIHNSHSGKLRKSLKSDLEIIKTEALREVSSGSYLFDERFDDFLKRILHRIREANPMLKDVQLDLVLAKSPSLNAYCMPDGTIALNLGLFLFLENEEQVAAIVCHEIGHKTLNHFLKKQKRDFVRSLDNKALKAIKMKKYGRSTAGLALLKNLLYEDGSISRSFEMQSDSIGFTYFRNAAYSEAEFIKAFELTHEYDTLPLIGLEDSTYKLLFDIPGQSFQDGWLVPEDFSGYTYVEAEEIVNSDSISSHPEMDIRIENLEDLFGGIVEEKDTALLDPSAEFLELQELARLQVLPNLFDMEYYGTVLYRSMYGLQKNPNDLFNKYWLGASMQKIAQARKSYTLNRYVDRVDTKNQSPSYQTFLNFIWNLDLKDMQGIASHYYSTQNELQYHKR